MNNLTIGKSRRIAAESKNANRTSRDAKVMFSLGSALIAIMLVFSFIDAPQTNTAIDLAVPVMSSGVTDEKGEELQPPDKDTLSQAEEWSIYDYIGRMFADLIFGER